MKYKVLLNSSLPEVRVALTAGQTIDDEIDTRLTPEAIKRALDAGMIEVAGKKKEAPKKETKDE